MTHSSGALILSGSGGYIAGTLGTAIAAPVVISIGAFVGGTAVTVELLCAPKNHPDGYKKVVDAAQEFQRRTSSWISDAKDGLKKLQHKSGKLQWRHHISHERQSSFTVRQSVSHIAIYAISIPYRTLGSGANRPKTDFQRGWPTLHFMLNRETAIVSASTPNVAASAKLTRWSN